MIAKPHLDWHDAARLGATYGVRLTVAYALLFIVYACARAVIEIVPALQAGAAVQTSLAVIVSLLVAAASIGVLMALFAALLGAVTALVVYGLLPVFDPGQRPRRASAVGGIAAGIFAASLVVAAQSLPGGHLGPAHPETWLFWLVLPLTIYVCAAAIGARRLNTRISRSHPLLIVR